MIIFIAIVIFIVIFVITLDYIKGPATIYNKQSNKVVALSNRNGDEISSISKVKCTTCKHLIDKEDAQEITTNVVSFITNNNSMLYYCPMHKKPYTQKLMFIGMDTETKYFGEVEMTEDGTPVGYKSCPKK